jgi:hypothetical protein
MNVWTLTSYKTHWAKMGVLMSRRADGRLLRGTDSNQMNKRTTAFDVEELRVQLREMTDRQLNHFLQSVRHACGPIANFGQPPRPEFLVQRAEGEAELERRRNLNAKSKA